MKRLIICNTVYQLMTALWIIHKKMNDADVDMIVTDHMKDGEIISERINERSKNISCYFVKDKEYSYNAINEGSFRRRFYRFFPEKELKKFVELHTEYDEIFFANLVDRFVKLIVNAYGHMQHEKPELILYEDGILTYSKQSRDDYLKSFPYERVSTRGMVSSFLFKDYSIREHLKKAIVYRPDLMEWELPIIERLPNIDLSDTEFIQFLNYIFNAENSLSEYDRKYIFMEESFVADGKEVADVQLVDSIAARVGKDNIMIKVHPRNPVNRFKELGYKTNTNVTIPWEVVCMNIDISKKVLITIGSASILTPAMLLGKNIHAFSLYEVVQQLNENNVGPKDADYWATLRTIYEKYSNMIHICKTVDEIS